MSELTRFRDALMRHFPKEESGGMICTINGDLDPTCVWDKDNPSDCLEASKGTKKKDCEFWVLYTREALHNGLDLHNWIGNYFRVNK